MVGVLTKRINKPLSGSIATIAGILVVARIYAIALSGTLTSAGALSVQHIVTLIRKSRFFRRYVQPRELFHDQYRKPRR
jgi:hypothetical protein